MTKSVHLVFSFLKIAIYSLLAQSKEEYMAINSIMENLLNPINSDIVLLILRWEMKVGSDPYLYLNLNELQLHLIN